MTDMQRLLIEVTELRQVKQKFQNKNVELEKENSALKDEIAELKLYISMLEGENSDMSNELATEKSFDEEKVLCELDTLKEQNEELTSQVAELKKENIILNNELVEYRLSKYRTDMHMDM